MSEFNILTFNSNDIILHFITFHSECTDQISIVLKKSMISADFHLHMFFFNLEYFLYWSVDVSYHGNDAMVSRYSEGYFYYIVSLTLIVIEFWNILLHAAQIMSPFDNLCDVKWLKHSH